ncbi:MAG: hypothetical protein R3E68_21335 [Burkholderiaceae bacterium]
MPASPAFAGNLQALEGADVKVLFLESYGAITYDVATVREAVEPSRQRFAAKVAATGRRTVSAFQTAPTFAGAFRTGPSDADVGNRPGPTRCATTCCSRPIARR